MSLGLAYTRIKRGGGQYLSDDYQALLRKHGKRCGLSGADSYYDNAAAESFFSLLKRERVNRVRFS